MTKTNTATLLKNYSGGEWTPSHSEHVLDVKNPATQELLAKVPLSTKEETIRVIEHAHKAFPLWRNTPPIERIQFLFKLKNLLEENQDALAETITKECGKTLDESRGEVQRGIENVEVACGIPMLMQGYNLEDIASGIDEFVLRQPLGVVAAITPFNFPAMIPLWFLPYAIACGNCFILKASEKVPVTAQKLFSLLDALKLPSGVVSLVNGAKDAVDVLLEHPLVRAVSFVGSKPVGEYIYSHAAKSGKRVQCQAGAKNHVVIMPDADMQSAVKIVSDSAFGCAGQRCLALSVALTVGNDARKNFTDAISEKAASLNVGYGLEKGVQVGPLISHESKMRVEQLIEKGKQEGAVISVDGRNAKISGYENGNFVKPTILNNVPHNGELSRIEIFGPVLSLTHAENLDDAISIINNNPYGNAASIFTKSGEAARKVRHDVHCGNIGVNIGVPAPMAFFPFSGWKDSFFGVLHGQGRDAVEFYTDKKVVVERWPKEWSRKF